MTGAGTVLTLGSGVAIDESGDADIQQGQLRRRHRQSRRHHAVGNQQLSHHLRQWIPHQQRHDHGRFERRRADVDTTTFTNSGTLAVSNGDTVTIEPTTFTNLPAYTLAGGTYEAEAGSKL